METGAVVSAREGMEKDMNSRDQPPLEQTEISAQLRGETVAYAVQHAIYSLGANLYEPYINQYRQKRYSRTHPSASAGTYGQNLIGELAGDVAGAGTLILSEALFPSQLHTFMRK